MIGLKRNGSLARWTLCWPNMITYVLPIFPRNALIEGGHLGWRAHDSRELLIFLSYSESNEKNTSLFTAQGLGHLPKSGKRLTLSIPDPHDPQPTLPGNNSDYLMGTQPTFETERGEVDEEVYGIWVDRGRGVVVSPIPDFRKMELIGRTCIIGHIILLTLGNLLHLDGLDIVCCSFYVF
jgi:hypothetical protein